MRTQEFGKANFKICPEYKNWYTGYIFIVANYKVVIYNLLANYKAYSTGHFGCKTIMHLRSG